MKKYVGEFSKLYIALMFTLVPLVYEDNFYGILDCKTRYIFILTIGLAAFLLPTLIIRMASNVKTASMGSTSQSADTTDILAFAMLVVAFVSSILSDNVKASLTGSAAWRVGSVMMLLCVFAYFIISRFYNTSQMDIWFFLYFGAGAVIVFSLLDRLGIDLLDMFVSVVWEYDIFTSTIGNVDFYATFISLILPIFILLPLNLKKKSTKVFTYLLIYICFVNMHIILTNAIFLGVGVAILFVIYYSLLEYSRLKNLSIVGFLFGLAGITTRILSVSWPYRTLDRDSVVRIIMDYKIDYVIAVISVFLFAIWYAINRLPESKRNNANKLFHSVISKVYLGIVSLGVVVTVICIILNASLEMGNYRGYIWYMCLKGFFEGGIKDKILGVGPGLIDSVIQPQIQKSTLPIVRDYWYRTAHSEFVEFFVTNGILGAVSYIGMLISVFIREMRAIRSHMADKSAMVFAGLVGYVGQAFITGPYALNFALFFVMLGIWSAYMREDL